MDISDVSKYGCLVDESYESPTPPSSRELLEPVCKITGLSYDAVRDMDMGDRIRAVEASLGINFIENTKLQIFLRYHNVNSMDEYYRKEQSRDASVW
ncbi:hypothetical protein GQ473_05025 [archaeon]|nr:hypothetical protein [archaeon]